MDTLEQLHLRVLVLKCQIGDQPSWDELYRRYNPSLGYYLRRLIGQRQAAEDAQQETWLSIVRGIARLKSADAFTVWLYRIARSKAMPRGSIPQTDTAAQSEPVAPDDTPEEEFFRATDAALVHAALERLEPAQRDVLLLRFMEELSYEQIAEVIECNIGTVRSRIHYAKSALRLQLENKHE
jgi:RNA polymerase sigma-70 factor (ECF subfamily)